MKYLMNQTRCLYVSSVPCCTVLLSLSMMRTDIEITGSDNLVGRINRLDLICGTESEQRSVC